MAQSVFEVMAGRQQSLLEKLGENPDLCNLVLALLGKAIVICSQRGLPLEGIEMGTLTATDLPTRDVVFRAPITFHPLPVTAASIWPPQSDFAHYTRSKAYGLGMALQKNPKLAVFFQSLVQAIETYAQHRGLQFGKLKVQKSIISTSNVLVLQVGENVIAN